MKTNYTELRDAIISSRMGQTRWRCPAELRAEIVDFTQARQREGVSVMKVAKALGMSASGLKRWLPKGQGRLRPVRVCEEASSRDQLVLVTPGGYRLEGLSASCAADVLRRLGC